MEVSCIKDKEDVKLVALKLHKSGNETDSAKRFVHCSSGICTHEVHNCVKGPVDNDNDLGFSAKQVNQKAIKEVHGFSKIKNYDDDDKIWSQNGNNVTLSAKKVIQKALSNVHDTTLNTADVDVEGCCVHGSGDVMLSAKSVIDKVIDSRKRKRESSSLSQMLNWVKNKAKYPDDLSTGKLPECSKGKQHRNSELWFQALLAREALLIKRHVDLNVKSSLQQQKKLSMHPSMYEEDVLNQQSDKKSRVSQRLPWSKAHSCSCCKSASQSKVTNAQKAETGYSPEESPFLDVDISAKNKTDHVSLEEPSEKEVCVGAHFQAEVPEWTGVVCESDAKWLGKRMWPPEDVKELVIKLDHIGKGRPSTCDCSFPGNVECIRFHIAEKRLKLKRECGLLFYKSRFDRMGEEVSLSWTEEQEKKFKDMVRLNSASINKFWSNAFRLFPSKTRDKLVSYYFNVLLVRRRSYQNRVTPKDVDSDDDEREFGSVGDSFGYKAIYVPESKLPICFENKQCEELE